MSTDARTTRRSALVVLDLQLGTTVGPKAHAVDQIVPRVRELADLFRSRGLPVVWATVDGTPAGRTSHGAGGRMFPDGFAQLVDGLGAQDGDRHLVRRSWSALAAPDVDHELREVGITEVVIVGIATSFGVESTARQAYDLGYDVVIVEDAVTDNTIEAHEHSMTRVLPALARIIRASDLG